MPYRPQTRVWGLPSAQVQAWKEEYRKCKSDYSLCDKNFGIKTSFKAIRWNLEVIDKNKTK